MGDMTKDFSRAEFQCKCCTANLVKPRLVLILQAIRDHFGTPIKVVSGTRCARRNKMVGGAKHSKHMTGEAADIQVKGVKPKVVRDFAAQLLIGFGGLKAYSTFTHVDIRQDKWRG